MIDLLNRRRLEIIRVAIIAGTLLLLSFLIQPPLWRAISFAVAGLLFAIFGMLSPSHMQKNLSELNQDIEKMADGNLQILQTTDGSRDSTIHDFSISLLVLNSRLRQVVGKVKNVVESVSHTSQQIVELSRTLIKGGQSQSRAAENAAQSMSEINAEIERIADAAESLNHLGITAAGAALQLTASIEEVMQNALKVGEFAKDTQASMQGMVAGMNEMEQARQMLMSAAAETERSMQHMHGCIQDVTDRAVESDAIAERASAAANVGSTVVSDVEYGMQKIADAFQNAKAVVGNLAQRSQHIGEILTVITQVADQTNLLSLNAAILSAQAGVHGKGFAVVADEIRKLSNRTASSVKEIEQLISTIQIEMKEAVDLMEAGEGKIAEGLERSGKASEALSEIIAGASASRERVAAITQSSRQQILAEKEVLRARATIQERLDQLTRLIEEQTHVSTDVYSKAQRMIELLANVEKGMREETNGAKEVSSIVEHLSGIIQNIHTATSAQSGTSREVMQSVDSLRAAVQSGTATIRAMNSTALALDQESFILKSELARFRLPSPKAGGALSLGLTGQTKILDPAFAQSILLTELLYSFYEGLTEYGEGAEIVPCLAEDWQVSEDGLTYTIHLKRGARFHNGKEVTARDVKDSFERILDPATNSSGMWTFEMVEGVDEYSQGKAQDVSGIQIVGPFTLRIRLREPVPFFLGMLAQPYAYVMPSELARRRTPLVEVCGTGPFRLDRFVPEQLLEMSKFSDYHHPPEPYLDQITLHLGVPENQIAEGMKTGSFHFTSELEKDSLQEFLKAAEWRPRLQTNVQLYTSFLALDVRTPPLNDVRVRQALAYAVDRERIVRDIVGNERGMIARSLLPPGLPGNDPNTIGYIYDPSRARALLKQANVADGTRLEMWQVEESPGILQLLGLLQENLKDIGLGLQIRFVTSEELDAGTRKRNIPMRLTRWVADYPDPDSFLYVPFHSGSTVFNIGFSNAEFDRLVEEARCMADIQERMRLYQSAERIWMQECPCICLYHNRSLVLHQQKVQGCMPTFTTATVRLKKVWLS